ncbi:putative transcription elongation factor spt-4 protein [Eutypa lata UCREL1]|uniref:Transcription elongation factor SPT4 n=1 Tax=Eutypa lata (strain UCR-EL1) TaxID=1287681 RepID=M7U0W1_EUTLA|nr:putative transcription elongation factor spt-4 protein [Eutypa lata UCREL1]
MSENFIPPSQMRYARACMVCSIVLTQTRFKQYGCPNCPFLELRSNPEAVDQCTSQVFEGLISIADPKKSWIAKWQRVDGYVRGCYATKVSGSLPDDVKLTMEEEGLVYIP